LVICALPKHVSVSSHWRVYDSIKKLHCGPNIRLSMFEFSGQCWSGLDSLFERDSKREGLDGYGV
jgi:hypothetical protein